MSTSVPIDWLGTAMAPTGEQQPEMHCANVANGDSIQVKVVGRAVEIALADDAEARAGPGSVACRLAGGTGHRPDEHPRSAADGQQTA